MSKNDESIGGRNESHRNGAPSVNRVMLLGVTLLVLGGVAYLAVRQYWIGPILAHAGAFGLLIILSGVIALIAKKKGYGYGRVLFYGMVLPMLIGLLAVLFFYLRQGVVYCGGSVVLGVSILLIIFTALLPRKLAANQ